MNSIRKNKKAIILFTAPALLLYTLVVIYPIIQTFWRSFYKWDGLSTPKFINIRNYTRIFSDHDFYISLVNGLKFSLVLVVYQIGLGAFIAFTLFRLKAGKARFFRNSFFVPVVLSTTVVCQLWLSILNGHYGLLNQVFKVLGINYAQDWLSSSSTAIWVLAFVNAWQFMGYHMVLIYTAVKAIPEHFFEAAAIDGATSLQTHLRITFPLLAETFKICLIFAVTGGLKAFEQMAVMTGGGPGTSTFTLTYFMYRAAFRLNEYGYACTSATILVIECLIFTIIINRFVARERIVY